MEDVALDRMPNISSSPAASAHSPKTVVTTRLPEPSAPVTHKPSCQQTSEDNHERGHRHARAPDGGDG